MKAKEGELVPGWISYWYMFNFLVLPYDAVYILMRPTNTISETAPPSALITAIFSPLDLYSTLDGAFGNAADTTVRALYLIGVLDLLLQGVILRYVLMINNGRNPGGESATLKLQLQLRVALLVVIQSAELATKTAVYLIYSWPFIRSSVRIPITLMNSIWTVAPLLLIGDVVQRVTERFGTTTKAE